MQEASSFVADKVFPIVPVKKQSDRYFVYDKGDFFRDEAAKRAPATESAGGGYDIDNTPNYYCEKWAYHKDVTEEDRANSDSPLKADQDATEFITQKLLIKREVEWATRFFATSLWTYDWTGAAAADATTYKFVYWSTAGSTPIKDIAERQIAIQSITGRKPNVLVLGPYVYMELRNHAAILDRIKYTQRGVVTTDLLEVLFDVEHVYVAQGIKNAAAKGATEDTDFIMGKNALLAYSAPKPGLMTPSAGYIFSWTGLKGAGAYGNRVYKLNMDMLGIGTQRVEGEMAFDANLISADLGCFFSGIVE